jgi:hypothetical protein
MGLRDCNAGKKSVLFNLNFSPEKNSTGLVTGHDFSHANKSLTNRGLQPLHAFCCCGVYAGVKTRSALHPERHG